MNSNLRKNRLSRQTISSRRISVIFVICLAVFLILLSTGCGKAKLADGSGAKLTKTGDLSSYRAFEPVMMEIIPLTEIKASDKGRDVIELYIALLDKYGESLKVPVSMRFELYEYIERSGRIKGNRVFMWSDIALTEFESNSEYWQKHLDAYRFELDLAKGISSGKYVLHCTCRTLSGSRLNKDYVLDYRK